MSSAFRPRGVATRATRFRAVVLGLMCTIALGSWVIPPASAADRSESDAPDLSQDMSVIAHCLEHGLEAVLHATKAPSCESYMKGVTALDKLDVEMPYLTDSASVCRVPPDDPTRDRRILGGGIIKELIARRNEVLNTRGLRIIGGIYCDGLDLNGLHVDYPIALDRSIFLDDINMRNFRSEADFSIDSSVVYKRVYMARAEVGGSFFAQFGYIGTLIVSNSTIKGALKLAHTIFQKDLTIDSDIIGGDVDLSYDYFSYGSIVKNRISGVVDLGQTQARCYYDIRKNEIGDLVITNFGFGKYGAGSETGSDKKFGFYTIRDEDGQNAFRADPMVRLASKKTQLTALVGVSEICEPQHSVAPGTFVFLDNHVKASLCFRAPRWLRASGDKSARSTVYLNENIIEGQTWLDFTDRFVGGPAPDGVLTADRDQHDISVFNIKTGTLILNFDFEDARARIKVNGLHFSKIYSSNARCEASVSLRSSQPIGNDLKRAYLQASIPPDLRLPKTDKVLAWIDRNTFKATQPFSEFVGAFERAGDLDGARDLKTKEAWNDLAADARKLTCLSCSTEIARSSTGFGPDPTNRPGVQPDPSPGVLSLLQAWIENFVLVVIKTVLWLLADHGFRPERIGWYILGTLILFLIIFHLFIKVVGFSVEDEKPKADPPMYRPIPKIHPIGLLFLFDHMLPAYKIREKDYKVQDFYVRSRGEGGEPLTYLRMRYAIEKASPAMTRKVEAWLNVIRFIGLIYLVFVLAAVSKAVR